MLLKKLKSLEIFLKNSSSVPPKFLISVVHILFDITNIFLIISFFIVFFIFIMLKYSSFSNNSLSISDMSCVQKEADIPK
ncbi:hypothetical protein GYN10_10245 [Lactococcus piscium]|nr:hypothetical protein [Lactococcus carnosus]MCJ1974871.1 hypothetical protein [Lactococcus carnosus]MCJ1985116.1 hypothetical protein [Lactococcus carnosus]MCJ2003766.1 hypothetical protein [Lactococcus carnosus]